MINMADRHNLVGLISFYPTSDLESTREFYSQLLKFKLVKDQGVCLIYEVPGGGHLGFCSHMTCLEHPEYVYITWVTEDVDLSYERLRDAGVCVIKKPELNSKYMIYQALFLDNNGYTLEIQKFIWPSS